MWFSLFRGGVHPDGFKELSACQPVKKLPLPSHLYIPLRQHAGSEAIPVVRPGENVLEGQLIGRSGRGLSAPVHAPTSGKVLSIGPVTAAHPSGYSTKGIVIEADGKSTPIPQSRISDPFQQDPEFLARKVADYGIVGMGGATFPSAVKLQMASEQTINTLIINGGECEPYLTSDDLLMQERPAPIVLGARLIQYIIKAERVAIVIEDNKTAAIEAMRQACAEYAEVEVVVVPTRYPMGSAKQMIQAVTKKEVPAGSRSTELGVLVYNVATAYAICKCLNENKPLISRIVTVSGGAIAQPRNVEALIGTPLAYLIEHCGGLTEAPARLLLGGPMMGQIMPSDQAPLIKGAGGVLALRHNEINHTNSSPCIRCGRCVEACPMGLVPLEMANHARKQEFEGATNFGLSDCILCGSCAYVCPSHIPLVHYFQYAKGEISQQKAAQKRTEYTRTLSENRRLRQEKEAAEKAAAKAAKANRRKRSAEKTD
jgi:electron transport complex protein RnfC